MFQAELLIDLHAQREGADVRHDQIFDALMPGDQTGLHRGAQRHDLVRIQAVPGLLTERAGDQFDHGRHARRSADEDDFVNILALQTGIAQDAADRQFDASQDRAGPLFEIGPRDRSLRRIVRQIPFAVGQADRGRCFAR